MKLWCDCCDKVQPVEVTDERCAKTYAAYQDIMCTECHLVIASGNDIRHTWVGLTEQEHTDIAIECGCMSADWVFYGATVERILKEKNS